jgi:general secretion pathway protein E
MLQLFRPQRARHEARRADPVLAQANHPGLAILTERGLLGAEAIEQALAQGAATRQPLPVVLVELGLLSGYDWAALIAERYGLERGGAQEIPDTPVLGESFSARFLRQAWVLPLAVDETTLWLGMADPADEASIKAVRLAAERNVVPVVVPVEDLKEAYARLFESGSRALQEIVDDLALPGLDDPANVEQLIDLAKEAPVVRLVNQLLTDALRMAASDIHIEPYPDRLSVRYRIHGRLKEIGAPPAKLAAAVVSRIKILAKLDIAERRLPQDGRSQLRLLDRPIDLRVATMPTIHGESLVIRLLDQAAGSVQLDQVGLRPENETLLRRQLAAPHGMILVTGPTGSGKTTTLYGALRTLDAAADKIISIEDPIEYQIAGVTQIQVKPEIELSFSRILRSVVRHDPNVIMVGETRDAETAEIAVHAALTGHLMLTTLHTNSAAGAVARLLDMGVEPYLLASVLRCVIGQRLVGVLCELCKEAYVPSVDERHVFECRGIQLPTPLRLYRPGGCRACNEVGFTGRIGIFEMLEIDEPLRELIRERAPSQSLQAHALTHGMTSMFQDGLFKALAGMTTLEEVCRVTEEW